jgi:hypothetical protein
MPAFYITLQSATDRKSIGGIFFRQLNGQSSAWFEFNKIVFDSASFREDFIDALHTLNRKLAGQRLVLLLDELDQVFEAGRNDLSMIHEFRGALQNCNNIFSVLAGSPRVNELSEILCFPLAEPFFLAIKPAIKECGYECLRIDKKPTNKSIIEAISKGIREARFIIVDVSRERPNCYYEFGLAHGFDKEDVIPIIQKDEKIHFDVTVYPHLKYDLKKLHILQQELKERILGTVGHAPK